MLIDILDFGVMFTVTIIFDSMVFQDIYFHSRKITDVNNKINDVVLCMLASCHTIMSN